MSEKKLSLVELHFHDSVQFGPRTIPGLGGSDAEAADGDSAGLPGSEESPTLADAAGDETDDDESGPWHIRRFVGLAVLAAAAYAVKKLLDGESSGLDALDDIEATTEDMADESAEATEPVSIEVTDGDESTSSSGRGLKAGGVVALLVVLVLVARKLLGNSMEEIEIPDELADE